MVSPGGSNTYIPSGSDEKEEYDMPNADPILDGEEQVLMRKLRAENAELNDELTKIKAELAELKPDAEKDEYMDDEDDDEALEFCGDEEKDEYMDDEDEELKQEFSKLLKTKKGSKVVSKYAKMKRQRNIYKKRAVAMAKNVKKQKYGRILDQLQTQGYRVRPHRATMLSELMECKDPLAKVKFWKATMKKVPFGKKLQTDNTRQRTKVNFSAEQKQTASTNAVDRIALEKLDAASFQKVYQQELRKL